MSYIIRLSEEGYYGKIPYRAVPKKDAMIFPSMKEARATLNRLNGRLIKEGSASIERKE